MARRILAAAFVLLVAAALLIAVWPQLFGLQRQFGFAQVVSFRGIAAIVAGVGVAFLILVALLSRAARRLAATLAIMLLVFAGISVSVLAIRGTTPPGFQKKAAADLTVLSWNTEGDAPGPSEIARLAVAQHADIVSLPETSLAAATEVSTLMAKDGIRMQVLNLSFDVIDTAHSTSLLISTKLGEYRRDDSHGTTKALPSVLAVPVDGTGPTIVAAHPVAPVSDEMSNWRYGLNWLAARCSADTIIAGDFNSTLDHWAGLGTSTSTGQGDLGVCHDGARAGKSAGVATWPTSLPQQFGTTIDHVIAGSKWTFVGFRVIGTEDGANSDHRPIVAQLRPEG
jgi:endonuclease/exonuclease/phosphatase (EEP) superfamily protein YafD